MKTDKVKTFMTLAGQPVEEELNISTEAQRKLGAQLLLSEVLEYVIVGLGILTIIITVTYHFFRSTF